MTTVFITQTQVDSALPKIAKGLQQYQWLQSRFAELDEFYGDRDFRRHFNHFYKVRRGDTWQRHFYGLMGRAKQQRLEFPAVLDLLHKATGRCEASFASKLVATLDPSKPVLDAHVLKNLGLHLPLPKAPRRTARVCEIYEEIASRFSVFLKTKAGAYLVTAFSHTYPTATITDVKMLDLVLWQTRGISRSTMKLSACRPYLHLPQVACGLLANEVAGESGA